jgi:hypothetical protein
MARSYNFGGFSMPVDKTALVGVENVPRIVNVSSFAATLWPNPMTGTYEELARFRIGKGDWIVQAWGSIQVAVSESERAHAHMTLSVTGAPSALGHCDVEPNESGSIALVVPISVPATAEVALSASYGGGKPWFYRAVLAAVLLDGLTIFQFGKPPYPSG